MNKHRKEITFGLKVEDLKKEFGEGNYAKGYEQLNGFFCKTNCFEHRQGSVYCSIEKMSAHEVYDLVDELNASCPWLRNCLTRMDVADIGDVHELTDVIKESNEEETENFM